MVLYEALSHPTEGHPESDQAWEEARAEFEKLPKEQRTPYKFLEILEAKLAEKGVPFVHARVHAEDAEEARRLAEIALEAAVTGSPPSSLGAEPAIRATTYVYPLADMIFIDPPPEGGSKPLQPEHLVLGAAAILWLAALLLSLKR